MHRLRELIFNWVIISLLEFIFQISLSTLEGLNDLLSIRLSIKFLLLYSKNSIDSSLPFSFKFSLWSEWNVFLIKLEKLASYWSKPWLLSRSCQFNLYRKVLKFLANSIVPYLFKWSKFSFKCFAFKWINYDDDFYVPLLTHICQASVDFIHLIVQVIISRNY